MVNGLWVEFSFPELSGTTQETTQESIILLIKSNPRITRRELAEKVGLTSDGIKYHLQKMTKAGLIQHVGATKAGYWKILE